MCVERRIHNHCMVYLQAQEEQIMTDFGPEDERLEGIYERMEELDPAKFEVDAAKLLHGLGFDKAMMAKGTKDMSGETLITPLLCSVDAASPLSHVDMPAHGASR